MENHYSFVKLGIDDIECIKELFKSVFTLEPWNDDWSDAKQLHLYLMDLIGQGNSLTYGLYEDDLLIGVSMGHIKHWYSGTEYFIDEFCIRTGQQGRGIGSFFLRRIETAIREIGLKQVFLQTDRNVPAYRFYLNNAYRELESHVSFAKRVD